MLDMYLSKLAKKWQKEQKLAKNPKRNKKAKMKKKGKNKLKKTYINFNQEETIRYQI